MLGKYHICVITANCMCISSHLGDPCSDEPQGTLSCNVLHPCCFYHNWLWDDIFFHHCWIMHLEKECCCLEDFLLFFPSKNPIINLQCFLWSHSSWVLYYSFFSRPVMFSERLSNYSYFSELLNALAALKYLNHPENLKKKLEKQTNKKNKILIILNYHNPKRHIIYLYSKSKNKM